MAIDAQSLDGNSDGRDARPSFRTRYSTQTRTCVYTFSCTIARADCSSAARTTRIAPLISAKAPPSMIVAESRRAMMRRMGSALTIVRRVAASGAKLASMSQTGSMTKLGGNYVDMVLSALVGLPGPNGSGSRRQWEYSPAGRDPKPHGRLRWWCSGAVERNSSDRGGAQ